MPRHIPLARMIALCASCLLLAGPCAVLLRADDVKLKAVFGLAGRYRPGTWCPVTVSVQNPGADAIAGQVQVLASSDPGRQNYGGQEANSALTTALFARPVSAPSGTQSFVVYARGIDPGRDSVTVQLTDGRARGDGRLLSQITNQTSSQASGLPPAITGSPIGDTDLLLVSFGGEQGAFNYLAGQKLGLGHQSGGGLTHFSPPTQASPQQAAQINSGIPPTVQIADASAADLPDKAAGYSGVDAFLLRSDAPLDTLTEAQTDALRGWVAGGGHLIVCGGVDPSRFGSAFFTGLLPATVGAARPSVPVVGVGQVGALTLVPKPLPGVRVLGGDGVGGAMIVSGSYGAGTVTMTAYDPTTKPFQSPTFAAPALWQTLLTAGQSTSSSLLGHVAAREENYSQPQYGYYNGGQSLLSDAVMRAPSLDAPGTEIIGLFLLVYLIALVPANYLVLKRLDRKELAWVTIPALVLVFALGTFGVGYAAKGGSVFLNRASVLETTSGQRDAGVFTEIGLFSPHRTSYDITLPGANVLAAIPNPGVNYGNGERGNGDSQSYGQTRFVQMGEGAALQDTSVNMWAMRAFDAQSTTDLGGSIDAGLSQLSGLSLPRGMTSWGVSGTIHNRTRYDLSECAVLYNGQWQDIGDLKHGANASVSISAPTGHTVQGGFQIPALRGAVDKDDAKSDVRQRMRAALADYARSLGQAPNNYYGNQQQAPALFSLPSDEALLLGWSSDPALAGPAPAVDGHSVRENDVTLVVVHLPVSPASAAVH